MIGDRSGSPSGVKNADEQELKAIASSPEDTHVYNVAEFDVMADIVDVLTKTICERMEALYKQIKGLDSSSDRGHLTSQSHLTSPPGHVTRKIRL